MPRGWRDARRRRPKPPPVLPTRPCVHHSSRTSSPSCQATSSGDVPVVLPPRSVEGASLTYGHGASRSSDVTHTEPRYEVVTDDGRCGPARSAARSSSRRTSGTRAVRLHSTTRRPDRVRPGGPGSSPDDPRSRYRGSLVPDGGAGGQRRCPCLRSEGIHPVTLKKRFQDFDPTDGPKVRKCYTSIGPGCLPSAAE